MPLDQAIPISKNQCMTISVSGPLGGCRSIEPGYEELDQPAMVYVAVEARQVRKTLMDKDDIVWLIHWPVGVRGTGRRVLRVHNEAGVQVYFGPRTHDVHDPLPFIEREREVRIADMESYPIAALQLPQRRRLEEIAGKVGDEDRRKGLEWVCRVLKKAYTPPKRGTTVFEKDTVLAAMERIERDIL